MPNPHDESPFAAIPEAIQDYKDGKFVIIVDDEERENEGDLCMACEFVTPEAVTFMAREGCGLICVPMLGSRLDELKLAKPAFPTGPDIAQAIRAGRIDCGIATRSVARSAGLDFLPLAWERFDLVLRQRDYFMKGPQALFDFMREASFRDRAAELGGYDVSDTGAVRLVN